MKVNDLSINIACTYSTPNEFFPPKYFKHDSEDSRDVMLRQCLSDYCEIVQNSFSVFHCFYNLISKLTFPKNNHKIHKV